MTGVQTCALPILKDEFFDWLNECPVQWVLNRDDEESMEYIFYKDDEDDE